MTTESWKFNPQSRNADRKQEKSKTELPARRPAASDLLHPRTVSDAHPTHLSRDCTWSDSLPPSSSISTVSLHIITWYRISCNGSFDLAWQPCQLISSLEKYNILRLADYYSSVYLTYPLLFLLQPILLFSYSILFFFFLHAFLSSCWTGELNIWRNGHLCKFLLRFGWRRSNCKMGHQEHGKHHSQLLMELRIVQRCKAAHSTLNKPGER